MNSLRTFFTFVAVVSCQILDARRNFASSRQIALNCSHCSLKVRHFFHAGESFNKKRGEEKGEGKGKREKKEKGKRRKERRKRREIAHHR